MWFVRGYNEKIVGPDVAWSSSRREGNKHCEGKDGQHMGTKKKNAGEEPEQKKEKNNSGQEKTDSGQQENDSGQQEIETKQKQEELIEKSGGTILAENEEKHGIELITIIGEIEGHENLSGSSKTTKYEHLLPRLAQIEDAENVDGILILLNTMGGDVEAGLAIAEMIASLSKPTVSLVLGGSHSIGVPIAVSTDYSFIVESAAMIIHPVRMNGMVIGTPATFDYFKSMQDRITGFVTSHSRIEKRVFEKLMMETKMLTKDVGSILVGSKAVQYGIIDAVGGLKDALAKLHEMIAAHKEEQKEKHKEEQREEKLHG